MKKKPRHASVTCYADPNNFLQAAELLPVWKKITDAPQFAREMDAALTRSRAWHELKAGGADIFTEKDTRLSASFYQMQGGLTNTCFRLQTKKGNFFLRVPGKGSEEHLSRQDEAHNVRIAQSLGFNIEIFFFNPKTGLYAGEFLNNALPLTPQILLQKQTMSDVAGIFKTLHSSPVLFKNDIPIFTRLNNLLSKIKAHAHTLLHDPKQLTQRIKDLERICQQDASPLVACHNDPTYLNFLYQGRNLKLLDWEYSGNNKALFDLANFAHTSNLSKQAQQYLLQAYYGKSPTKQLWQVFSAYKQVTCLWYYLWAELQLANHSNVVPRAELIELAHTNWNTVMGCTINLPKDHTLALDFS
jgi:thiamine kinase-like enzyme